jgi:hypothetical protein
MRGHAALIVVGTLLQVACYNYLPLSRSHLVPSTYLAVTLTESGSDELAPYIGPNVLVVRGRFLSATERGFAISVAAVENRRGIISEWKGESVVIPGEFVRSVEERRVARSKTVLLAGASVAGFLITYAAFGPGATGTDPMGSGAGPSPH